VRFLLVAGVFEVDVARDVATGGVQAPGTTASNATGPICGVFTGAGTAEHSVRPLRASSFTIRCKEVQPSSSYKHVKKGGKSRRKGTHLHIHIGPRLDENLQTFNLTSLYGFVR